MIDQTTLEGKVITAAFDLAASPGWEEVSLRDIADAAGVPLADVMEKFGDKIDVLKVFARHVDLAMLAGAGNIEREQSARDAVFEVIMSRFDAMMPYKAGLKSIIGDRAAALAPDPALLRMALATQNKVLQAAGISAAGASALLRQLGLARIYAQTFRTWLDDDDPGMAKTMAALDRRLRQGEMTLRTIDDVNNSVGRICDGATAFAARVFSGLRCATERHEPSDAASTSSTSDVDPPPSRPPEPGGPGAAPA